MVPLLPVSLRDKLRICDSVELAEVIVQIPSPYRTRREGSRGYGQTVCGSW